MTFTLAEMFLLAWAIIASIGWAKAAKHSAILALWIYRVIDDQREYDKERARFREFKERQS